jgi:hypothetical protein
MDLLAPNSKSLQISRLDLQKLTLSSVSLPGLLRQQEGRSLGARAMPKGSQILPAVT